MDDMEKAKENLIDKFLNDEESWFKIAQHMVPVIESYLSFAMGGDIKLMMEDTHVVEDTIKDFIEKSRKDGKKMGFRDFDQLKDKLRTFFHHQHLVFHRIPSSPSPQDVADALKFVNLNRARILNS